MINIVENPSNPSHLEWEKNKNRKKIQPIKSWKILFLCHNKTCILVLKKKKNSNYNGCISSCLPSNPFKEFDLSKHHMKKDTVEKLTFQSFFTLQSILKKYKIY